LDEESRLRKKLSNVSLADGISAQEALVIADAYFYRYVGCGALHGVRDGRDHWIVEGGFGAAGQPITGFKIEKRSGRVDVPEHLGPSIAGPFEIFPPQ
jgi:hypothetical protein